MYTNSESFGGKMTSLALKTAAYLRNIKNKSQCPGGHLLYTYQRIYSGRTIYTRISVSTSAYTRISVSTTIHVSAYLHQRIHVSAYLQLYTNQRIYSGRTIYYVDAPSYILRALHNASSESAHVMADQSAMTCHGWRVIASLLLSWLTCHRFIATVMARHGWLVIAFQKWP
jgi:hypothetical protein